MSQSRKNTIPGGVLDRSLSSPYHTANLMARAQVRQNIFEEVGSSNWGADTNIHRVTHRAITESGTNYGLVATGSGAYESGIRKLRACALNLAARSNAGAGFSARLIVLHSMASTIAVHNLYIQNCARTMDRGLRAQSSAIASSLSAWSAGEY